MSFDIDIREIEYSVDEYDSSCLKLEIHGKDVGYQIVNALRKVSINQIPIYAFHPSKINILRNNSVFDNSYMRERLSQLPILKFNHNIKYLATKYYKDVNFADPKLLKHSDDINDIELYIKAKNIGPEHIMNVSTSDIKYTINNEVMDNSKYYSPIHPILLIQLRAGEEFECSMKGVLAVGELDSIFNASNAYYEEITDDRYEFYIESTGQLDEYEILIRGCDIIIEKLGIIKENVNQNQYQIVITENNSMILEILNEDYTCGGPLNYHLQNHPSVLFSGITNPDFMQKNIIIKFKVKDGLNPIDIFNESVDSTEKMFNKIKKIFMELYQGKDKKKSKESILINKEKEQTQVKKTKSSKK